LNAPIILIVTTTYALERLRAQGAAYEKAERGCEAKGVLRLSLRTVSKVEPPFKGRD
jgi:hypothetical protein